jgi:hypothetical protein
MIDQTKIHQQAAASANAAVPSFEIGTPEHTAWLAKYDSEFARLVMRAPMTLDERNA